VVAHVFGYALSVKQMTTVALAAELIPVTILFVLDPANFWQAGEGERTAKPTPKQPVSGTLKIDFGSREGAEDAS
jgi:hypothetical protein